MKLELRIPSYPHEGGIEKAVLRGRMKGKDVPLVLVTMEEMRAKHDSLPILQGCPLYVAWDEKANLVWLHPLPNGEYHLDITVPKNREASPVTQQEIPRFAGTITRATIGVKK